MKSTRFRYVVRIAVIAVIVLTVLQFYTQHQNVLRTQMTYIGEDLVQTTNSTRLIIIGPNLQQKLNELLASKTHVSKVLLGDEPGLGDGRATGRLILTNAKGVAIGIRLCVETNRPRKMLVASGHRAAAGKSEGFDPPGAWIVRQRVPVPVVGDQMPRLNLVLASRTVKALKSQAETLSLVIARPALCQSSGSTCA